MSGAQMIGGKIPMVGAHQCQCTGGENMPETQPKGSYVKGGKSPQAWPNLRGDPGGKAYAKIDWRGKD